jgi:phosphoserine phosphatase
MKYKAVAFDLDGTLVTDKSSWWKLHKYFGTYKSSLKNMTDYEHGKITYDEFMRLDIGLWKPRPHVNTIKEILLNYTLTLHSKLVTKILNERRYTLFIVTSAPDILANAVARELGIPHLASNGLIFDEKGYLTQNVVFNVDLMKKENAFATLIAKEGLNCDECIGVGDSKYDIGFLRKAGLGIAFNPDDTLRKEAMLAIDDMNELLQYV